MTDLVYIDTETTGLDPNLHEIWEIAWAVNDGDIMSRNLPHSLITADPQALAMNGYYDRGLFAYEDQEFLDVKLKKILTGNTLVAANPAFDAAFLRARWGVAPWHYRMIDVESMALGILGYDRPKGLAGIVTDVRELGYTIHQPSHSALSDVVALRDCYRALRDIMKGDWEKKYEQP